MDSDRRTQLEIDGNSWYKKTLQTQEPPENKFLAMAWQHGNAWYTQVGLAIAYIFLLRGLSDYLAGGSDNDEEEDD